MPRPVDRASKALSGYYITDATGVGKWHEARDVVARAIVTAIKDALAMAKTKKG